MNYVDFTATPDAAAWGTELAAVRGAGRTYIVEPSGEFQEHRNVTHTRFPRESDSILPQPRAAARARPPRPLGRSLTEKAKTMRDGSRRPTAQAQRISRTE